MVANTRLFYKRGSPEYRDATELGESSLSYQVAGEVYIDMRQVNWLGKLLMQFWLVRNQAVRLGLVQLTPRSESSSRSFSEQS